MLQSLWPDEQLESDVLLDAVVTVARARSTRSAHARRKAARRMAATPTLRRRAQVDATNLTAQLAGGEREEASRQARRRSLPVALRHR